jgi:hypothetical protein
MCGAGEGDLEARRDRGGRADRKRRGRNGYGRAAKEGEGRVHE